MAGAANSGEESSFANDDNKFGFNRPEMNKEPLASTIDPPYERHVFLRYKSPKFWPPRIENSDSDPFLQTFSAAFKLRKSSINVPTRFTVCGGHGDSSSSDGDVLIFPDMIKYSGLAEDGVPSFIDDVLVGGNRWSGGPTQDLTGAYVFICAHGSRDQRCGFCGPRLVQKFKDQIDSKGLQNKVFVMPCSHVGGHKYAGNVIIFSPNVTGHWYGYVTPGDVDEILDEHIGKGRIITRLSRGRMGASKQDAIDDSSSSSNVSFTKWNTPEFYTAGAIVGAAAALAVTFSLYRKLR